MSALFDPLTIRDVQFNNRIWVSPMCQYMAKDGFVGQWHDVHLGSFATGGTGLIMVEATGVVPEGRISIGCPSIEDDAHANAFKQLIDFAHGHDVKIGIQLAPAGRKGGTMLPWDDHRIASPAEGGWQAVSSSAIAFEGYAEPVALTIPQIHQLTQDFVDAAKRAVAVGFDVIELHAAHGYLFHQFYSPLANNRTDEYGGEFANRTRFLLETVELCTQLKALGVDLVDVSTGGNVHNAPIKATPGFQVPFATAIRAETGIMTTAVGLITEPEQADHIIQIGEADAVFMAREFLRNPRFPLYAAEKLGVKIKWPLPIERGRPS